MKQINLIKLHTNFRLSIEHGSLKTSWIHRISYWSNRIQLTQTMTVGIQLPDKKIILG